MVTTDVVIAGAGPIGLTAAIELRRQGIRCRVVDPLLQPPQYAKAVGIQPRTLEIFEGMGVVRQVLDASIQMRGQIVYVNGAEVARIDLFLPPDVPYEFIAMPQYETERVLREHLSRFDTKVERGRAVASFQQDDAGVEIVLSGPDGDETVRASYLVGCDGAHSTVRKAMATTFEGGAFTEQYMLGDVEVDWTQPVGYGIRSMHQTDGKIDDLLVCIPLPGRGRYRMSMLVPNKLSAPESAGPDALAHGFEGGRKPELADIQDVIDRLSPEPAVAANLRWSSVFRVSHRIAGTYGRGRVFIAGDAAHIHPPTGAQGMNTGIQDAHNLAWKLALAVRGIAADGLLDSYDAERRPIGEEVVGRTVRHAREGIGAGENDPAYIMQREAQLLIDYDGSPIVGPGGGRRAPDAYGLRRDAVAVPLRLFTLLDRTRHTLLLYADAGTEVTALEQAADAAVAAAHGELDVYVVAAERVSTVLPVAYDVDGTFAKGYAAQPGAAYVVRPDGYLGFVGTGDVVGYLKSTFV